MPTHDPQRDALKRVLQTARELVEASEDADPGEDLADGVEDELLSLRAALEAYDDALENADDEGDA